MTFTKNPIRDIFSRSEVNSLENYAGVIETHYSNEDSTVDDLMTIQLMKAYYMMEDYVSFKNEDMSQEAFLDKYQDESKKGKIIDNVYYPPRGW
jgi:hypothetical protein